MNDEAFMAKRKGKGQNSGSRMDLILFQNPNQEDPKHLLFELKHTLTDVRAEPTFA